MLNVFRGFRDMCNKVLPTVYDDSLSYYEVLCKVIKGLGTIADAMDEFTILNTIRFEGEWSISKAYMQWSLVDVGGNGYISIKPVPIGINIDNEDYWRLVANYSALYADFQNRVIALENGMINVNNNIDYLQNLASLNGVIINDMEGADDDEKVENAIAKALSDSLPIYGYGNFTLNDEHDFSNINFIDLSLAKFITTSGIIVSASNGIIKLPKMQGNLYTGVGITIKNCVNCVIIESEIHEYETGLLILGDGSSCSYNNITLQEIRNCHKGLYIKCINNGWCNQNIFNSGRIWCTNTVTTLFGSDLVMILTESNNQSINNNVFLNVCIESSTSNPLMVLNKATINTFIGLRCEDTNAPILVSQADGSRHNIFIGCYGLSHLKFDYNKLTIIFDYLTGLYVSESGSAIMARSDSANNYDAIEIYGTNGKKYVGLSVTEGLRFYNDLGNVTGTQYAPSGIIEH